MGFMAVCASLCICVWTHCPICVCTCILTCLALCVILSIQEASVCSRLCMCMRTFTMNEYRELYTARGRVWTGPAHIIAYWRWRRCFLGGHWAAVTSDEGSQEARGRRTTRGMGERQHIGWKGVAVASMDGVPSPGNVTPKETGFGGMKRVMEPQRN